MGLDQYLHLSKGFKTATDEDRENAKSIERYSVEQVNALEKEIELAIQDNDDWNKNYYTKKLERANKYFENKDDNIVCIEFAYWRKHSDLHGYMEKLYRARPETPQYELEREFNCVDVILEKSDIETLIKDLKAHIAREIPFEIARGFFWGSSHDSDYENSLEVFEAILKVADFDNDYVIYCGDY